MMTKIIRTLLIAVAVYQCSAVVLHYWIFPEAMPDSKLLPSAGDVIVNRFAGERTVFTHTAIETDGKFVECVLHLQPGGAIPKSHIHRDQDETFEVQRGRLRLTVNGEEQVLGPGERYTVPMGAAHQPFNAGAEELVATVRLTPAGQADMMLAQVHGFLTEHQTPRGELEWFLQVMLYVRAYHTYLAEPPIAVQDLLAFMVAPTSRLLGYRSWYPDYSLKWKQGH